MPKGRGQHVPGGEIGCRTAAADYLGLPWSHPRVQWAAREAVRAAELAAFARLREIRDEMRGLKDRERTQTPSLLPCPPLFTASGTAPKLIESALARPLQGSDPGAQ